MTDTTDVAWTVVVRIEDTDRWIDWSTGHRTVPDVLAAAELIVPVSTIAEIRFDRITTARKRFSLADLGATDATAPSAPAGRAAILREAADELAAPYEAESGYDRGRAWVVAELRRMADEAQQPEVRKACGCGQDGCEYCDVDDDAAASQQAETQAAPFYPPAHYRGRDGTAYCVHAIPVGPDSCRECRALAEQPAAVSQPGKEA